MTTQVTITALLFLTACSSGAGSTGGPTLAEASDGSDAGDALGMTHVDPVLPTPCDATCGADGEHACLGPHPEVESVDLAGQCVFLCDDPMTDPGGVETCVAGGGECVVLTGGLVACIPVP
jgi:hypothetical protein